MSKEEEKKEELEKGESKWTKGSKEKKKRKLAIRDRMGRER